MIRTTLVAIVLLITIGSKGYSQICPLGKYLESSFATFSAKELNSEFDSLLQTIGPEYGDCVHNAVLGFQKRFLKSRRMYIPVLKSAIEWDRRNNIQNDSLVSKKLALLGAYQKNFRETDEAISNLQTALIKAKAYYPENHIEVQKIYQNIGECHYIDRDLKNAKTYLDIAYSKFVSDSLHHRKQRSFKYYAKIYAALGELKMFNAYNLAFKSYTEKYKPNNLKDYYRNILHAYYTLDNNDELLNFLHGLKESFFLLDDSNLAMEYHNMLSIINYNLKNPTDALYHGKAYRGYLNRSNSNKDSLILLNNDAFLLSIHALDDNHSVTAELESTYKRIYNLALRQDNFRYQRLALYNLFIEYYHRKEYKNAYLYYTKINQLIYRDKYASFDTYESESQYLVAAIKTLQLLYDNTENIEHLKEAYEFCSKIDSISNSRINNFLSEENDKSYLDPRKELYMEAIGVCYKLFQLSKQEKYFIRAQKLIEKNKALILVKNVKQKSTKLSRTNSNKERSILVNLKNIEASIELAPPASNERLLLANQVHKEVQKLLNLKASQPNKVDESIYESTTITCPDNTLQFFTYDSLIYRLYCYGSKLEFDTISFSTSLKKDLQSYTSMIGDPTQKIDAKILDQLSKQLLPTSLNIDKALTIIPDGILNYLPFSTFMIDDGLLINKAPITYAYSLSHLSTLNNIEHKNNFKFSSFAPAYNTYSTLSQLKYNVSEVSSIKETYPSSKIYVEEEASLDSFIHQASNCDVIHVAAHAKSDTTEEGCHIYFTDSDPISALSLSDIYKMNIPAELVTLSACETGTGENLASEGVLSLARGFAYAGAKSVVSSLWSANDQSTSMIMSSFYKYLSEGQRKDEALRNAKLDYLAATDEEYHHPYYWAAFIPVGDMSPLPQKKNHMWLYGLAAFILGAGGVTYGRKMSLKAA